jgi:hypothetical protein
MICNVNFTVSIFETYIVRNNPCYDLRIGSRHKKWRHVHRNGLFLLEDEFEKSTNQTFRSRSRKASLQRHYVDNDIDERFGERFGLVVRSRPLAKVFRRRKVSTHRHANQISGVEATHLSLSDSAAVRERLALFALATSSSDEKK